MISHIGEKLFYGQESQSTSRALMEIDTICCELVLLLCNTTTTFGLVTVTDMLLTTRYGILIKKVNHCQ